MAFVELLAGGVAVSVAVKSGKTLQGTWKDCADYARASGVIYGVWHKLFSREKIRDLMNARSVEEVARVCAEAGYAELPQGKASIRDYEEGVQKHLKNHFGELFAAIGDKNFLALLQARHDYSNAQLFFKARVAQKSKPVFSLLGTIDFNALWELPLEQACKKLPKRMCAAAEGALKKIEGAPGTEGLIVDLELQKALFEELREGTKGRRFFEEIFSREADLTNLKLLFKSNFLCDECVLRDGFIPGGTVSLAKLSSLHGKTPREVVAGLKGERVERTARRGVEEFEKTGFWNSFDKAVAEEFLAYLEYFIKFKGAGPELVYYYYTIKSNEAFNVLKILKTRKMNAGKKLLNRVVFEATAVG